MFETPIPQGDVEANRRLAQEAADTIRRGLREAGYTEREVFDVDKGFDWNDLRYSANSMSLYIAPQPMRSSPVRYSMICSARAPSDAPEQSSSRPPDACLWNFVQGLEVFARGARQQCWEDRTVDMRSICSDVPSTQLSVKETDFANAKEIGFNRNFLYFF